MLCAQINCTRSASRLPTLRTKTRLLLRHAEINTAYTSQVRPGRQADPVANVISDAFCSCYTLGQPSAPGNGLYTGYQRGRCMRKDMLPARHARPIQLALRRSEAIKEPPQLVLNPRPTPHSRQYLAHWVPTRLLLLRPTHVSALGPRHTGLPLSMQAPHRLFEISFAAISEGELWLGEVDAVCSR